MNFVIPEMAPGKKCWGTKTVRVPTVSEASKIFRGHTFRRRRQVPSALSRLAVMDAQSSLCCAFLMASA